MSEDSLLPLDEDAATEPAAAAVAAAAADPTLEAESEEAPAEAAAAAETDPASCGGAEETSLPAPRRVWGAGRQLAALLCPAFAVSFAAGCATAAWLDAAGDGALAL